MTIIVPSFDDALVVREADAEVLGLAQLSTRLLADSNATGGALSVTCLDILLPLPVHVSTMQVSSLLREQ